MQAAIQRQIELSIEPFDRTNKVAPISRALVLDALRYQDTDKDPGLYLERPPAEIIESATRSVYAGNAVTLTSSSETLGEVRA